MASTAESALAALDTLRSELLAAREQVIAAIDARGEVIRRMRPLWLEAHAAGVSVEEIIRRSGVARQTVYDSLPKDRSQSGD